MSRRQKKGAADEPAAEGASALHAALLVHGGDAVSNQVQMWLTRYEEDNLGAVAELATLLVQAAGSSCRVTRAQVENVDAEALTAQLVTDEFKKAARYPLDKDKTAYHENFCAFWSKLVLQAGDVVFDEFLMAHVAVWVEMLSNWEVRSFRHVGTVTGNQLVGAFIALRNKRLKQQAGGQKKKSKGRPSQDQQEAAAQVKALEELIESFFNSVFVIRYRDVSPEIRCLCIRALGSWIPDYDQVMMDTRYVKYLGWALYDLKAPVRLAAAKVLGALYANDAYLAQLDKFTARFQDRLGGLPDDKDHQVACAGIRLCASLAKAGKLNEAHVNHIYELLLDKNAHIRSAAAEFATVVYFGGAPDEEERAQSDDDGGDASASRKHKVGRRRSPAQQALLSLVQFVARGDKGNTDAVVQTLLAGKGVAWLHDWDAMAGLLLEDDSLTVAQQEILARAMLAAVSAAMRGTSKADKKVASTFGASYAGVAHALLERFAADPEVAAPLVVLVKFVPVDAYAAGSGGPRLKQLLALLGQLFLEHTDAQLLKNCVVALVHLSHAQSNADAADAVTAADRMRDELVRAFSEAASALAAAAAAAAADQDALFAVESALLRLSVASLQLDLRLGAEQAALLKRLLDDRVAGVEDLSAEAASNALRAQVLDLIWSLSRALKGDAGQDERRQDELQRKRDDVLFHLERLLARGMPEALRTSALKCTLDVLRVFGAHLGSKQGLSRLRVTCPQGLCDALMSAFHDVMDTAASSAGRPQQQQDGEEEAELEGEDKDNAASEEQDGSGGDAARRPHGPDQRFDAVTAVANAVCAHQLPISCASDVLLHYGGAADHVREAMRGMLGKLRKEAEGQRKGENEYKIMLQTLKLAFARFRQGNEYADDRQALRALSLGLSRTYGAALSVTLKASLALLMQEAAPYALGLGDVGFVFLRDCLMPFTAKMPQPDKILSFFDSLALPDGADDSPYTDCLEEFRNHLRKLADPASFKTPLSKRSKKAVNPRMQLRLENEEDEQQQQQQDDREDAESLSEVANASAGKKKAQSKQQKRKGGAKRKPAQPDEDDPIVEGDDNEQQSEPKRAPRRRSSARAPIIDADDKGKEEMYPSPPPSPQPPPPQQDENAGNVRSSSGAKGGKSGKKQGVARGARRKTAKV